MMFPTNTICFLGTLETEFHSLYPAQALAMSMLFTLRLPAVVTSIKYTELCPLPTNHL